jgi:hypothetical protein
MKAYDMLNERKDKFAKLPPLFGKRTAPPPMDAVASGSPPIDQTKPSGS